jgi:Bacterial Ig domain/Secretion system C-terminal sorting domain
MKPNLTLLSKRIAVLTLSFLMLLLSAQTQAQLGVYSFTGVGACPNQNPVINAQPANATFSNFSAVGASCYGTTNVFATFLLNSASTINLGQYYTFTVTAAPNNVLDLDSLKFDTYAGIDAPNAKWHLRSNLDNYATDIAADSNSINAYTTKAILSNTTFLNIPNVTFRLYVTDMNALSSWGIDEVKLYGKTIALPAIPSNNINSNAPQCASSGVIITSNILPPAGEHWYWQTSATGISTTNGTNTYTVNTSGTYYLRAQDDATLLWSSGASSITVTVTPLVGTPVFTNGLTSTRCQAAGSLNVYQSTAPNGTGGTRAYSLDNASLSAGLTISNGGAVSYPATWVGDSYITVTYTSCDGSTTSATHTTTTTAVASSPTFALGTTSTKCIGAAVIQYSAAAANTSGITYSMSSSGSGTNPSISASTGVVTYAANFNGTVIITATGIGCNGTVTSTHTVTTTPNVAVPIFSLSTTSSRCFGAGVVTYTATATNSTSVVYNLDAASITAGNTIVATTGEVTYTATWGAAHLDSSIITATALGCSGPAISTHKAISKPAVSVPVFAASASTRCQGGNLVTYIATASNYTTLRYTLDATTAAFAGNSINSITGVVAYAANWSGTTIITATAQGCNGPQIATHTVTTTPTVGTPIFSTSSLTRCQGAGVESYTASATNSTSISYSLSPAGAGTINAVTGAVTYTSIWSGVATITATAIGCNGPKNSTYIVTSTPTVGTPIFSLGLESVRDQIIETITYNATATNNTGITYSLDPASLSAGNTINASTGAVTWSANWFGVSSIIASANGCNGPVTSSHIVNINAVVVQTPLYLSTPSQTLDRIDPVATNITTTVTSNSISSTSPGITLDANSTGTGLVGPIYVSHTTGTGRNRLMLVSISNKNRTVLSVTYGSTPLILVGENNVSANARVAIYKLINPPSGLNTVTVNFSANPTSGAVVNVSTYTGVDLINPLGSFVSNEKSISTTGTSPNVNVSTTSGDLVYDVVSALSATVSVGAGQTQRFNNNSGSQNEGAGSSKLASTTSTTISWTTSSTNWAIGAVAIKPEIIPNNISFTQSPALCSNLIIKAQTVQVLVYANVISGIMPVNPAITASLKYGTTTFVSLSNPVYNSSSKVLSWTGTLPADVTVPSGQAIELNIASAQAGVEFQIDYHSATKPSRISLLPVSTFIDIISFDVFNAPYPGGIKRISGNVNTTYYVRAKVATPFGYKDITGLTVNIIPSASNATATCVDSTSCTRTYEYAWTTLPTTGTYDLLATAREGYENLIKNSDLEIFDVCTLCPPIAAVDSATGGGGAPIVVDILANDYDPNNNIKVATLSIPIQSNNGTGYIANGKIIYLPNGTFAGKDTLTYQICDSTGLCATSKVYFTINPTIIDICSESTKPHIYFIPYPEQDAFTALTASSSTALPSSNIRTVISITLPYPNMTVVWDQWEDGYELNSLNPLQATTKVWGDGNPYNGIAPGYSNDIIPAGGSIILDNTMPANPRVATNFFYDGKDKITASGQIAVTQVCGEPTNMPVQAIKTNVTSTFDYGRSFTVPLGENFASQDFKYTALFVRAEHDNTTVQVDKDNDGTLETTFTLNQGQSYLVNGGVKYGATLASNNNIGVELNSGGVDGFSIRNASIFPATWYSNVYYTPVSTSDNAGDSPKDTSVVMFYNSLSRPISVNWSSGVPASGTITLPAKTSVRFPLAYSTTAAYKFVNPTGEAFTAIEIVDSYTPGGGGNDGQTYDWSFNLIAESRLTDFATTAWAPGGLDLVAPAGPDVNGNPIWVTPNANTTVYVKWDGKVSGSAGSISPCGLKYDVSYNVNALNYIKLRDPNDNDQSGIAIFTCNGAKLAAVYGEDPEGSTTGIGIAYWDVGTTILPFCKQKLILANDDYARTIINQPVTIPILLNDFGFLAVVDPSTVTTGGLLQPSHGSVTINPNGTMIYTPSTGYTGKDTLEYNVCSTGSPVVCDKATVYIDISTCPAPFNENVLAGKVFLDKNDDGINNDGGTGVEGAKVYLYIDGNCSGTINANELKDSITVDASGTYQFITYPEKSVADDFDGVAGARTCANGTDGNAAWLSDWTDIGDPSTGFCNTTQSVANTDAEIVKDGAFTNAIRLKDNNVSVTRTVNLSGAAYAFLSFSYRRKSASLTAGKDIIVQASSNGTSFGTVFTIAGDGNTDANYVTIYNQDITAFAGPTTYIRFLTNNNVADADTVYIDNVKIQYISYPICYITKLDATTIPIYHHTTTILQHNMTATGSQTCLAPYDFGIAKNHLTISGTLFRDANGLTDNKVNGTQIGLVEGNTMYAYLSDSTGTVVNRTTVNATTGNYVFTNADVITNYTLQVSSMSVNVGDIPPTDIGLFSLTDNWVNTGDTYGKNNIAGTGIKPGTASGSVSVSTLTSNIDSVNVAIETLPDSYNKTLSYPFNQVGVQYDITGGLTGTDQEDGILGAGKTYKITELPIGAVLYYNGIEAQLNQVITLFNPTLLVIDPDDRTSFTSFKFASRDAAGLYDPTPAIVTISWSSVLPIKLISFNGRLNGSEVDLNWITESEINTKHFEVERSGDGANFIKIGTVQAKGNSSNAANYDLTDYAPLSNINYYRLKIVNNDGSFEYSRIVVIRIGNNAQLATKVSPNPFINKVDIDLTLTHNTTVDIRIVDVAGKVVLTKSVKGLKGSNIFTLNDLEKLQSALYMLHVVTDDTHLVEKLIKK